MDPSAVLQPLLLSLRVAFLATFLALLIGVAAAGILSRSNHPISALLDTGVNLPLVLPPTVLGYYLLVLWGAQSPLGRWLAGLGLPLVFTWRGAVLAASVVALPLIVQSSKAAMQAVDPDLPDVARTLGRSELGIFFTVTLPLARRGVLAGGILAFARALGEFGATLLVSGNIPGRTQTLPIAIYDAVQSGDQGKANLLALGLTAVAIVLLLIIRQLGAQLDKDREHGR